MNNKQAELNLQYLKGYCKKYGEEIELFEIAENGFFVTSNETMYSIGKFGKEKRITWIKATSKEGRARALFHLLKEEQNNYIDFPY